MTPTPEQVDALVEQIKRLLQGKGPDLQGAALADLVALFFAGHHPALRHEVIELWVQCMQDLIPVNEEQIFENYGGKPEGWEKQ
jgi:hypothetical protein